MLLVNSFNYPKSMWYNTIPSFCLVFPFTNYRYTGTQISISGNISLIPYILAIPWKKHPKTDHDLNFIQIPDCITFA